MAASADGNSDPVDAGAVTVIDDAVIANYRTVEVSSLKFLF